MGGLRKQYRKEGPHHLNVHPDFADVKVLGARSVLVTIRYADGPVGSYHSDYSDTVRFVCADGRLVWGGADKIVSHSEFGKNTGDRSFAIYADENGDLIYEERQQVHMNLAFGIPAGTAKHFTSYRFKKLSK